MKNRKRIEQTSSSIKQEILKQMMVKKYNELTVTSICEALDLSRRTFYLHFYSIDDAFSKIFDDINAPLYEGFTALKESRKILPEKDQITMLDEIFQLINNTIISHTAYLRRIATEPTYSGVQARHIRLMKEMISQYLDTADSASDIRKAYLDYYVSGILELYLRWYRGATLLTLDEIRQFAGKIMETDLTHFILPAEEGISNDTA